ncbi:MAG: hypothetical protein ACHBNF_08665 [Chromatiales bacterium]
MYSTFITRALVALSLGAALASADVTASDLKTVGGQICRTEYDSTANEFTEYYGIVVQHPNAVVFCPLIRDFVTRPIEEVSLRVFNFGPKAAGCRLYSIDPLVADADSETVNVAVGQHTIDFDPSILTHYDYGYYVIGCHFPNGGIIYGIRYWEP